MLIPTDDCWPRLWSAKFLAVVVIGKFKGLQPIEVMKKNDCRAYSLRWDTEINPSTHTHTHLPKRSQRHCRGRLKEMNVRARRSWGMPQNAIFWTWHGNLPLLWSSTQNQADRIGQYPSKAALIGLREGLTKRGKDGRGRKPGWGDVEKVRVGVGASGRGGKVQMLRFPWLKCTVYMYEAVKNRQNMF